MPIPSQIGPIGSGIASGFRSDSGCCSLIPVVVVGIVFYGGLYIVIRFFDFLGRGIDAIRRKFKRR